MPLVCSSNRCHDLRWPYVSRTFGIFHTTEQNTYNWHLQIGGFMRSATFQLKHCLQALRASERTFGGFSSQRPAARTQLQCGIKGHVKKGANGKQIIRSLTARSCYGVNSYFHDRIKPHFCRIFLENGTLNANREFCTEICIKADCSHYD
ncbi:hypothetical protein Trydic_g11446 [Trypoxylus dichotomus]